MEQPDKINARRAMISERIAREIEGSSRGVIPPRANRETFPLSSAQKRLWFMEQYRPGTAVNHTRVCYRLNGNLDVPALEAALTEVMRRHEVLRARFETNDGQPIQIIS